MIVATFDPHPVQLLQARRAAVPADHARPARAAVRPCRRRRDAGVRVRPPSWPRWTPRNSSPTCSAERIGAAGVVTGDDFTFGKGRAGDVALLKALGAQHGVIAEAVAQVLLDGERISSGRIREALIAGDIGTATHMLSRDLCDRGRGPARRRARPRARLSDREPRARRLPAAQVRHLCGAGDARRRQRASGRRQPRRPPDLRAAAGAARGASVRLRRRPLRPQDRGRAPRLHPRGEEVRRRRRRSSPRCARTRRRRGSCWRSNLRHR